MPAVVMGPGRNKAKERRERLLSQLSEFGRKKVTVLLLLWLPPFLSGFYYTLYYFTQQEPAGLLCYPSECTNTPTHHQLEENMGLIYFTKEYHPPFNPLGREMLETVPDYCRSRIPNIDKEGVCTWNLNSSSSNESTPCSFASKFFYIPPLVQTSVVTDFLLVCQRKIFYYYMKAAGSGGYGLGIFLMGLVADRWGRRQVILACCLLTSLSHLLAPLVQDILAYSILFFFMNFANAGGSFVAFIYSLELMWAEERFSRLYWVSQISLVGNAFSIPFAIGEAVCCLVTSLLWELSWSKLQMYLSLGNLWVLPVLYFFLPESLSWLISQRQMERANRVKDRLIPCNTGRSTCSDVELADRSSQSQQQKQHQPQQQHQLPAQTRYSELQQLTIRRKEYPFKTIFGKDLMAYTLIFIFLRSAITVIYFTFNLLLDLFSKDWYQVISNVFLFRCLAVSLDIPVVGLIILVEGRWGRRPLFAFLLFTSGLLVFFSAVQNSQITLLILVGRACLSGTFTILSLYMAMLYPATIRTAVLGWLGLVAGLANTLVQLFWPVIASGGKYHLLFLTFLLSMLCTIIALFLPETINDPLPETLNDIRFNTGKNDLGDCCSCISYAEEKVQFVPERAPPYPKQKKWSKGPTQEVRTRRTAQFGILL